VTENEIKCPECGHNIPINEVLKHRLNQQVNSEVSKRLENEKSKLENELKEKFAVSKNEELKNLKEKLQLEAEKRQTAEKKELEFLKKQDELEDKIKGQDLIMARKLTEEKKILEEKIRKEEEEKQNFALAEMRKQLEDTKKALTDAQRKAQQGSMQTQGEVLELLLEEFLKQKFPHDNFKEVPKGISGADIIQHVYTPSGQLAGVIAWESKRTKAWTEDWVQKLKDDSQRIKANFSVLVTEILPKEVSHFGLYKGVWVCDFSSVFGLTVALRNQLISVYNLMSASEGREEKKDSLYNYFCSSVFTNHIQIIAETFMRMKTDLDKEKNAFSRIWAARETQITRLTENTAKLYGEIQGIIGQQLPGVEILELESIAEEETTTEAKPKKLKEKNEIQKDQIGLF